MNATTLVAIVLALLAPRSAAAQPMSEAQAKAACAAAERFVPGPLHTATAADRAAFSSEAFCADYIYEIVGDEKNYDKARRCCLVKGDCNRELAMVFANGWGVPRHYDAATYFLCRAGDEMAPFEQWGMLAHVQKMRAGREKADLEYCDHVTSGRGQAFCAELDSRRAAASAEAVLDSVRSTLDTEGREALARLEKAANAFADGHAGHAAHGSIGGTAYQAILIDAQTGTLEDFIETLETVASRRAPSASAAALARADAALNAAYRRAMQSAEPCARCIAEDTGERDALREAQRAWIAYRDAWTEFYRVRWKGAAPPDVLGREIATRLTLARARALRQEP